MTKSREAAEQAIARAAAAQARDPNPHGLAPAQIQALHERYALSMPQLVSARPSNRISKFFDGIMPPGATFTAADDMARTAASRRGMMPGGAMLTGTGGNGIMTSPQLPYQPEFACFRAGTQVLLPDGTRKPIEEIRIGDRILDRTGRIQVVENAWCSGIPSEVVEVVTWGKKTFYSTLQHSWPVWSWVRTCQCGCGADVTPGRLYKSGHYKGGTQGDARVHVRGTKARTGKGYQAIPVNYEPLQRMRAEALRAGDFLLMPRKFDAVTTDVSETEARLLGYYTAEGTIDKSRDGLPEAVSFDFGKHEIATWVRDVQDLASSLGIKVSTSLKKSCCHVRTTNDRGQNDAAKRLVALAAMHVGEYSDKKRFSEEVMRWPVKLKRELIRGMFRGDGTQNWRISTKNGHEGRAFGVTYTTVSRTLVDQLQLILAQIGWPSRLTSAQATSRMFPDGKTRECLKAFHLTIPAPFAFDAADFIWGDSSQARRFERREEIRPECMLDDDFVYLPIKSVTRVSNDVPVYNLTVSGDHSYLVDNVATYNSPARQSFPVHRSLANIYWRLFYKLDPVFQTGVNLISEMIFSKFRITGEGIDGEIHDMLEEQVETTQLHAHLAYFPREFLVVGEVIPHLFFDETRGIWTHLTLHDPDRIEVIWSPFLDMDPILQFRPDDELRKIVLSADPILSPIRDSMPEEVFTAIASGENITLSPINASLLARRMHPYNIRGDSVAAAMWETWMYEDAIRAASIAVARRGASPLKVAKLGDPATGYIPSPEQEARLMELLAASETDPNCFTPETPVTLADGSHKPIGDVEVGDLVRDRNGKVSEVTAAWSEVAEELVRIHVVGSGRIDCTPRHRWPVWRTPDVCQCGCETPITRGNFAPNHGMTGLGPAHRYWRPDTAPYKINDVKVRFLEGYDPHCEVTADQLRRGDYLKLPRRFHEVRPHDVTPDKARLLGYYAAEGNIREIYRRADGSVRLGFDLSFGLSEKDDVVKDAAAIIERVVGFPAYVNPLPERNGMQVASLRNESTPVAEWLRQHAGSLARMKVLSAEVMSWPLDLKYEFLRGYLGGDGCVVRSKDRQGYVEVGSASETLIDQVRLIVTQLGSLASKSWRRQSEKSFGPGNLFYHLHIYGELADRLSKDVWDRDPLPRQKSRSTSWWADDDYVYVPVRKVERITKPGAAFRVVNISVAGDHSYCVHGGVGTFNSWLVYNYAINFDLVGAQERSWKIEQSAEYVERMKLIALGISKSFLWGEISYACVQEGTPVDTPQGRVPVENLTPGDLVMDRDNRPQRVIHAWSEGTPKTLTSIELVGGTRLKATHNHRWPVWAWPRECACGCGGQLKKAGQATLHGHGSRDVQYIDVDHGRKIPASHEPLQKLRSDELRVGDCLLIPRTFVEMKPSVPASMARLLGYYAAEGSSAPYNTTGRNTTTFTLSLAEQKTHVRDIEQLIAESGFGASTYQTVLKERRTVHVHTARSGALDLNDWLTSHAGSGARTKAFSEEVMRWPLEYKRELIRGLFRGDGWQTLSVQKYKGKRLGPYLQVGWCSASKELAEQVSEILIQLGVFAPIEKRVRHDARPGWPNRTVAWQIDVQSDAAMMLADLVWGDKSLSRKVKRARTVRPLVRMDEQFAYVPIRKIKTVKNSKPVYNIEVDGSHTYRVRGVATHNSAASGLAVFLKRMRAMRDYFESSWLIPKFFKPISVMNKWIKPTEAELKHNVRVRRSFREVVEDRRYITPRIEWENSLDPSVDSAMIQAVQQLEGIGVKFSRTTKMALVNRDFQTEMKQRIEESRFEQETLAANPGLALDGGGAEEGGGGGGGGGGGMLPGMPPEALGLPPMEEGTPPEMGGEMPPPEPPPASKQSDEGGETAALWDADGRYGSWTKEDATALRQLFRGEVPDDAPWQRMVESWRAKAATDPAARASLLALRLEDTAELWSGVQDWLLVEGYPPEALRQLAEIAASEGLIKVTAAAPDNIPEQFQSDTWLVGMPLKG